ncbi:MAG TPA: hypothetical protein PLE55_12475, partial [Clostridiales bacterium]|nr:hypothetical protein [Clostridiales bacterium]
ERLDNIFFLAARQHSKQRVLPAIDVFILDPFQKIFVRFGQKSRTVCRKVRQTCPFQRPCGVKRRGKRGDHIRTGSDIFTGGRLFQGKICLDLQVQGNQGIEAKKSFFYFALNVFIQRLTERSTSELLLEHRVKLSFARFKAQTAQRLIQNDEKIDCNEKYANQSIQRNQCFKMAHAVITLSC